MAESIENKPDAKQAILQQAEEYRIIANILLGREEDNQAEFNPEFTDESIKGQQLAFAKQEYKALQWKRELLAEYINKPTETRLKFQQEVKDLKEVKPEDEEYSKKIQELHFIQRLLEVKPFSKESDQKQKLQSVINEATCRSLKTKLEDSFGNLVMESGIKSVAEGIFERIEKTEGHKIEQIKELKKEIDKEPNLNKKSALEIQAAKIINSIIYDENIFKYINSDKKIGTESIQTFANLNENDKYEVQCVTQALLQKIMCEKYLDKYVLAGLTDSHALSVLQLSNGMVLCLDGKPYVVSYNLNEGGAQLNTGYYNTNGEKQWLLVSNFEITFQASQLNWLGIRFSNLKNYEEAKKYFILANELVGWSNPSYLDNLGLAYANLKEYKKAQEMFEKANKLTHWSNHDYLDNLGGTYFMLENYEEAKKYFILANELTDWNNPVYLNNLGLTYFKLKEYGKAQETYEKALVIDPKNLDISDNLKALQQYL